MVADKSLDKSVLYKYQNRESQATIHNDLYYSRGKSGLYMIITWNRGQATHCFICFSLWVVLH